MTKKQKQTQKNGLEAICKLSKAGLSQQEIADVLAASLNESIWKHMTPEQKAEYNNDFKCFSQKAIELLKNNLSKY